MLTEIGDYIWREKYRAEGDNDISNTWDRIANAVGETAQEAEMYYRALYDFKFIPAGRIIAGAGLSHNVTMMNCFVMGTIRDSMDGIFSNLREAALVMQAGGGIGYDFSTLRPRGALVRGVNADASGPVSFMEVWDAMCHTIMSAGSRRGAMMGTMTVDHPDIEEFIEAKKDAAKLRMFNMSVLVTDGFMSSVAKGSQHDLVFDGKVYRTVDARELWDKIVSTAHACAEPGVIFIDRINQMNNLKHCEVIHATNPCGEQPLPPYGACNLGSLNLTQFVTNPFSDTADVDYDNLRLVTSTAVRFLDRVLDITKFPLQVQREEALRKRRIGLGITGLADALAMLGRNYGSAYGRSTAGAIMCTIKNEAYRTSAALAAEKGVFPCFDLDRFLETSSAMSLPQVIVDDIAKHGLRNGCLTSIAPTGTISLLAGNISSGIEPIFDLSYDRVIRDGKGNKKTITVKDYAHMKMPKGKTCLYFQLADDIGWEDHLLMQAELQLFVDSSISKTINMPAETTVDEMKEVYTKAYHLGLKGCTVFRPNDITGSVISHTKPKEGKVSEPMTLAPAPTIRPDEVSGITCRYELPNGTVYYITVNYTEDCATRYPIEVFVNSKNMSHMSWISALTRMMSAVFRRGGDIDLVVSELADIMIDDDEENLLSALVTTLLTVKNGG